MNHEEVMTLIRLLEKASEEMKVLSEAEELDELPFFRRLALRRHKRALDNATNLVRGLVFKLTDRDWESQMNSRRS